MAQGEPPILSRTRCGRIGFDSAWVILSFPLTAIVVGCFFEHVVLVAPGDYHCLTCGYDLRGQVENRCPECGAPFHIADRYRTGRGKPPYARTLDPVARGIVIALIVALILWTFLVIAEFVSKL